jgi:hypothetical protein
MRRIRPGRQDDPRAIALAGHRTAAVAAQEEQHAGVVGVRLASEGACPLDQRRVEPHRRHQVGFVAEEAVERDAPVVGRDLVELCRPPRRAREVLDVGQHARLHQTARRGHFGGDALARGLVPFRRQCTPDHGRGAEAGEAGGNRQPRGQPAVETLGLPRTGHEGPADRDEGDHRRDAHARDRAETQVAEQPGRVREERDAGDGAGDHANRAQHRFCAGTRPYQRPRGEDHTSQKQQDRRRGDHAARRSCIEGVTVRGAHQQLVDADVGSEGVLDECGTAERCREERAAGHDPATAVRESPEGDGEAKQAERSVELRGRIRGDDADQELGIGEPADDDEHADHAEQPGGPPREAAIAIGETQRHGGDSRKRRRHKPDPASRRGLLVPSPDAATSRARQGGPSPGPRCDVNGE